MKGQETELIFPRANVKEFAITTLASHLNLGEAQFEVADGLGGRRSAVESNVIIHSRPMGRVLTHSFLLPH